VQVGTQQRSGIHYRKALNLLASGRIGKIHTIRIGLHRNIMPGFGSTADSPPPPDFDYDLWLGPAPLRPYNKNRGIYHFRWFWNYSGGQMTNYGAHDVDVAHWFMNVKGPMAVSSSGGRFALEDNGETPDTQDALFEYPGFSLEWSVREASVGRNAGAGTEFFGTKGSMTISRGGYEIFPDTRTAPENRIPQIMGHPVGGPQLHPDSKPVPWTEPVKERASNELFSSHVRNFLDCVKSRERPLADVEDGHRTVTACHLANISLRLGRKIRWDPEKEEIVGDPEASEHLVRPYRKPWEEILRSFKL
jgi:predicted dehydrogenase